MTDFLADLERELRAAHPRRGAARRRATAGRVLRAAPAALLLVAVLAGATAFVLSVGHDERRSSAPATPPPPQIQPPSPAPKDRRLVVLNGTTVPGLGRAVADFLSSRWGQATVTNAARQDVWRTIVRFAPGHANDGKALAHSIEAQPSPMDRETRALAPGADLVVVVGRDVRGARIAYLRAAATREVVGTVAILERNAGRSAFSIHAKLRRTDFDAVWLVSGPGERPRGRLLGYVGGAKGTSTLDTMFLADTRGRRIVISREGSGRPGPRPRDIVAFVDP
ncbi:MAG TPA: LytR C-terminal domain-containing protein [Solirubrobacteraceae bacterium]|jgi:hypothetical protein